MLTPAGSGIGRDGDRTGGPKCGPAVRQATSPDCAGAWFCRFFGIACPKNVESHVDLDARPCRHSFFLVLCWPRFSETSRPGRGRELASKRVPELQNIGHSEGRGPLRTAQAHGFLTFSFLQCSTVMQTHANPRSLPTAPAHGFVAFAGPQGRRRGRLKEA